MHNKITQYLDRNKEELFSLLSELLKIDTQNYISYGKEEAGQLYFADFCKKNGFITDIYCPDDVEGLTSHEGYLPGRGTDKRPNVTAVLKGRTGKKKITLAAHMDTMPVGDESDWSVPALGGVIKDNKIWGRGSSDDKFGIAAAIFAAKAIKECGLDPDFDLYVTSYVDEEYGGGNGALATCLRYPSDVYINLDGGGMQVLPYGIGGRCASASLHKDGTVSSCSGVFEGLKVMVEEFEKFGKKRFKELSRDSVFAGTQIEADAYRLLEASCGSGGLDLNSAKISFTYYTLMQQEEIEKELKVLNGRISKKLRKLGLVYDGIENISRFFHPVRPKALPEDAKLFAEKLSETYGKPVEFAGGCLSDLSVIHQYGGGVAFNTGLYKGFNEYGGPHQIDEYVDCDEFLAITKALALYLAEQNN
ncbi:MAG: M20 family metallopeptidase [Oscillospiraceae bacterium]|nr:M20 family metallopeptidase [Oscillospiraceae bacterium]